MGNRAAVVRVQEILYGRAGLPDLTGKEITIELNSAKPVKMRQQSTFFTTGGKIGETITVREVAHLDAVDDRATLRQRIGGIAQQQIEENVQRRIASSELIVVGKLVQIQPADLQGPGTGLAPEWYEAKIEVQSVEKGQLADNKLLFLFSRRLEIAAQKAPRLTRDRGPGLAQEQQGIWILHKNEVPRLGMSDRYTATDPVDFQLPERLPRIKQLIEASQIGVKRP